MKALRIGIIGAGRIGRLHANNLKSRVPGAELVAISDVYAPAAKEVAASLGISAYSDYHDILSDPAVDAVFICSSTDTHSPISIEAARAGKHIFCEKPIDHDLDKIKAVIEAVKASGVKRRFTGGKSRNLQAADVGKGTARCAAVLCGISLNTRSASTGALTAISSASMRS